MLCGYEPNWENDELLDTLNNMKTNKNYTHLGQPVTVVGEDPPAVIVKTAEGRYGAVDPLDLIESRPEPQPAREWEIEYVGAGQFRVYGPHVEQGVVHKVREILPTIAEKDTPMANVMRLLTDIVQIWNIDLGFQHFATTCPDGAFTLLMKEANDVVKKASPEYYSSDSFPEEASYPPPESEWPEKPDAGEGMVWERVPSDEKIPFTEVGNPIQLAVGYRFGNYYWMDDLNLHRGRPVGNRIVFRAAPAPVAGGEFPPVGARLRFTVADFNFCDGAKVGDEVEVVRSVPPGDRFHHGRITTTIPDSHPNGKKDMFWEFTASP